MRQMIVAIGAGLVLTIGTVAALATPSPSTDVTATAAQPPNGPEWCGFQDTLGSRVRCGYSSENDCKQSVGEPGAICIVDPYLTENRPRDMRLG